MNKNEKLNSRRSFLTFKKQTSQESSHHDIQDIKDTVKMLTPEGNLVEVDRSVLARSSRRKKASKEDIHNWTQNNSHNNQKRSS